MSSGTAALAREPTARTDVCVVGAGAAGLYASLCAAREGASVVLLSAMPLAQTASYWAQGGLAAALATDDTPELHLADTERAGRGAVRHSAAQVLVDEAPGCVHDLEALGFHFDADRRGRLALGLEGGHSVRRIVHAGGSATGRRLLRELSALVVKHERVRVIEGARMSGLLLQDGRCGGVSYTANGGPAARPNGGPILRANIGPISAQLQSRAVILSTGGAAALWARTTNPPGSIGQGLLLAHAAGAELADLEFVQFHPTAVIGVGGREGFLITEAIRGEGATLLDAEGERFVDELLPRDEVSRAICERLQQTGERSVSLDMRAIDPALFPNVVGALREAGLDPTRELVPVAPAAHYTIGGVACDLHGRSAVPGLYAVGETACTGLHGANRLASNSLSECFVFGRRAALAALDEPSASASGDAVPAPQESDQAIAPVAAATREALWEHAGIERSAAGLNELLADPHPLARMIARSALKREETRGTHVRTDHPERSARLDGRHAAIGGGEQDPVWHLWE
ncbi:MAG TPA: FAD-dependent oxidoreductase [Solirubrobacteraceae bacterium]|jgi:L-aspartate oxidase|nr:FAD-dependent oxidoreductase [Solirubrobacteraceae bacterium]